MRAIQPKTLTKNPESKVEWKETFQERSFRKFGYTSLGSPFLEILENVAPFATGSYQKVKPGVWVEWKAPIPLFS